MHNKEQIRSRINQRRQNTLQVKKSRFGFILLSVIMLAISSYYFGNMYIGKVDLTQTQKSLQNYALFINSGLSGIVNEINKLPLAKYLPFDISFKQDNTNPVSADSYYFSSDQKGYYTNDNKMAVCLDKGIVVYVNDERDNRYIVVSQDNKVSTTYANLNVINVQLYDRVERGYVVGSFEKYIKLDFLKNGAAITYEEANEN